MPSIGRYGAARVLLMPASPGTGVIAGGAVRAVVQAAGVNDILTKSFGSNNKLNLVKAAIDALTQVADQGRDRSSARSAALMQLHDVHQGIHRRKKRKRIGRGIGSGHGKTSTKGHKGHSSRQGFKLSPIFEGGQMPLARRVPKRGFFNGAFKKNYAIVNLDDLEARSRPARSSTRPSLRAEGLVKGHAFDGIKILGDGALSKNLEVHATKFSGSAASKIAAAGGKAVVVPYKPHAVHARSKEEQAAAPE